MFSNPVQVVNHNESDEMYWLLREREETLREHKLLNPKSQGNFLFEEHFVRNELEMNKDRLKKLIKLINLVKNGGMADGNLHKFILSDAKDFGFIDAGVTELNNDNKEKIQNKINDEIDDTKIDTEREKLQKKIEELNKLFEYNERIRIRMDEVDKRIKEIQSGLQNKIDEQVEIDKVTDELKQYYKDYYLRTEKFISLHHQYPQPFMSELFNNAEYFFQQYPRAWFLLSKKNYLEGKQNAYKSEMKDQASEEKEEHEGPKQEQSKLSSIKQTFVKMYDVLKWLVDAIDDAWTGLKNALPHTPVMEALGHGLIGGAGAIIGLAEGYRGFKIAIKAIRRADSPQRKTRIFRGFAAFVLGGAAVGMSGVLLAAAAGISIAAAPLMTVLVPAAVAAIYAAGLWKNSYVLHQAKAKAKKAKKDYKAYLKTYPDEVKNIEAAIKTLEKQRTNLLNIEENDKTINPVRKKEIAKERLIVEGEILNQQKKLGQIQGTLEGKKQYAEHMQKVREEKEAKVAFATIEVTAAILVTIGATLAVAAVIGLGVASFGIAPLVVTLVGVGIGFAAKIFEKIDERNDHKYSKAMRGFFVGIGDKIKNTFRPKKELSEKPLLGLAQSDTTAQMKNNAALKSEGVVHQPNQPIHETTLNVEKALHIDPRQALDLAEPKKKQDETKKIEEANKPKTTIDALDLAESKKKEEKEKKENPKIDNQKKSSFDLS